MDLGDLRRILSRLTSRGVLLKIAFKGVNFWALNPHFFKIEERGENSPQGNLPRGNAPHVRVGNLPTVDSGEITQGRAELNPEKQTRNSVPKNLFQESLEESLLCNEFPKDMLERWQGMSLKGAASRVEKEKEIFKLILKTHKGPFFEKCGRVISYLEKFGAVKDGKQQRIHSPMPYLENYWNINLARFEEWNAKQLHKSRKADLQAKAFAEKANQQEKEAKEAAERNNFLNEVADRFLELYPDPKQIEKFSLEALRIADSPTASRFYGSYGWNHPLVREIILDHFLKCESGMRATANSPDNGVFHD